MATSRSYIAFARVALTLLFTLNWFASTQAAETKKGDKAEVTNETLAERAERNARFLDQNGMGDDEPKPPPVIPLENETVLVLTKDNFNETVAKHRALLVLFYADWSSHSTAFRHVFVKAARALEGKVKLGRVDTKAQPELRKQYKAKGLPAMRLFAKGDVLGWPSAQPRTLEEVVLWAKIKSTIPANKWRKAEKDAIIEVKEDNIDELLDEHPMLFVKFHAPSCEACEQVRPQWAIAGKHLKGRVAMGQINLKEQRLGARFSITAIPTMKLFINKVPRFDYEGDKTAADMVKWVEGFEIGRLEDAVLDLETDEFQEALESHPLLLVQFYAPDSEASKVLYGDWVRAAHALKEILHFARVDVESERQIAKDHNIDVASVQDFPIVKLFKNGVAQDYQGSLAQKKLVKWAKETVGKIPGAKETGGQTAAASEEL